MRKAKLPLNPDAVKAADQALNEKHPELDGRKLTMGSEDAALRKEWMDAYLAKGGEAEPKSAPATPAGETIASCAEARATDQLPIPESHTRAYRAVSEAEYEEVVRTGQLQQGPNSMEGKWFADSLEGAQAHGKALFPDGKYRIIEVDVPDNAPSLFKLPNLDGRGPARYLHMDDLKGLVPRPLE